jgi:hypothetical protein
MTSGFNSNVRRGERVLHVQTEDRGPQHAAIDTAIYEKGRVLHHRSSGYRDFVQSDEFNTETLRARVERQHREVMEAVESGALDAEIEAAVERADAAGGIRMQLLNAGSWLSAGNVTLELEVVRASDRKPVPDAQVDAVFEGMSDGAGDGGPRSAGANEADIEHTTKTDERGRASIRFPLPKGASGASALVIRAKTDSGADEIRFALRSRPKTPPVGSAK